MCIENKNELPFNNNTSLTDSIEELVIKTTISTQITLRLSLLIQKFAIIRKQSNLLSLNICVYETICTWIEINHKIREDMIKEYSTKDKIPWLEKYHH